MKLFKIGLQLSLFVLLTACATMEDAKNAKGTGEVKTYHASTSTVFVALEKSAKTLALDIQSADKAGGTMLLTRGVTAASWGENIAVFVNNAGGGNTRVEIVNKAKGKLNITHVRWAPRIFEELDKQLAQAK